MVRSINLSKRRRLLERANMSNWAKMASYNEEWLYSILCNIRLCVKELISSGHGYNSRKRHKRYRAHLQRVKQSLFQLRLGEQVIRWILHGYDGGIEMELESKSAKMSTKFPALVRHDLVRRLNRLFVARRESERAEKFKSELERYINEGTSLLDGATSQSSDPISSLFVKMLRFLQTSYSWWKRIPPKFMPQLVQDQIVLFHVIIFGIISQVVQMWTLHRKLVGLSAIAPPWLLLYELKGLSTIFLSPLVNIPVHPSVKSGSEWVSSQLSVCNEILKESKRSFSEYARNRFLIPRFHFSLYEPMELIRQTLETKLGAENKKINLLYNASHRVLESIVIATQGQVSVREFPPVNQKMILVEPADCDKLSERFRNRRIPKDLDQATTDVHKLVKFLLKLIKHGISKSSKGSINTPRGNQSKSTSSMSFTKFLSSSFGSLELAETTQDVIPSEAQISGSMVQVKAGGGTQNFFEKYLSIDALDKPPPVATAIVVPMAAKPAVPTARPPTTVSVLPTISAPPAKAPIGQVSSIASIAPPTPTTGSAASISIWSGQLTKTSGSKSSISLIPLFRHPRAGTAEYHGLKEVLGRISAFQSEGSLSVAKFADHYAKLTDPGFKKKKEPLSFLISCDRRENFEEIFNLAGPPTAASAFTAFVPPYKVKLWLLWTMNGNGESSLPIIPGYMFGFMEMPSNLFTPTALANIVGSAEIDAVIQRIGRETLLVRKEFLGEVSSTNMEITMESKENQSNEQMSDIQPSYVPQPVAVPGPTNPAYQNEPDTLSRVFELIQKTAGGGNNRQQPEPEQASKPQRQIEYEQKMQQRLYESNVDRERDQSRQYMSQPPPPPQQPVQMRSHPLAPGTTSVGWSSNQFAAQKIVIGAPSTAQTLNDLPNPKRGACKFFNLQIGCQSGPKCKFSHCCSVCGDPDHPAYMHPM